VREAALKQIKESEGVFISVDYTHPSAVNSNADLYCNHGLPFVMGTTGGDRKLLEETVAASSIAAVIAPNMAKQIVGFQAMMAYAAETFPNLFKGYSLQIKESHQKGKADTSGTAKAMVNYFNALGTPFGADEIVMERDPVAQKAECGIPEEFLTGHGWHTYTLVSDDQTVRFEFSHNVNGREVYGRGTLDAVMYLSEKIKDGAKGKVYTMIDVLKGS
jgi:4-hydroxy-tetrahydrodipicolinate reductase